jgi:CubicO group peptidase (beta-lactamase class C family)
MNRYLKICIVLFFSTLMSCAQSNKQNYQGEWIGFLPNKKSFNFKVSLKSLGGDKFRFALSNDEKLIEQDITSSDKEAVKFNINDQLFFDLKFDDNKQKLIGFIKSGKFLYHVSLSNQGNQIFFGVWNAFMVDDGLQSDDINLYVEHTEDGGIVAYPFFGDQRFRGAWTRDFKKEGDLLKFTDGNTGFNFCAKFLEKSIELEILLTDVLITKTSLKYAKDGWDYNSNPIEKPQNTNTPEQINDGWDTASISDFGIDKDELLRLINDVNSEKLVNTHSVLITKENKLVFEAYFDGHNAHIPHDLRSASKSISSAMIGIAIEDKIIGSVEDKLYDYIPEIYKSAQDTLKAKIKIKDLLTMSSGLDVNNLASEDFYQNPSNAKSWLQTVMEAPMLQEPGTYADYGSANPFLLGICLNERLDIPLENYMDEKLFKPLGITNYINQTDDSEIIPYFGGGMLLTSRDLLKFGQLYSNKGKWNGTQIISEKWVAESFEKYLQLQDYKDKNHYGYFWWHDTYIVNGKAIDCIEARGAGGQFIFIIPELESVIVITSGNFRNRKGNQPRDILKEYLLPALLN